MQLVPVDKLLDSKLERLQLHQTFEVRNRVDCFETVFLDGLPIHFILLRFTGVNANEDGAVEEHEKDEARGELVALGLSQKVEGQQGEGRHYDAQGQAEGFQEGG